MKILILTVIIIATLLPFALWAQCSGCPNEKLHAKQPVRENKVTLAAVNKQNWINEDYYFTYSFDKKPKIGTHILIVKLFNKDKKLNQDYTVTADADMPSMKGAHSTGEMKLKPNKKGELLVPLNFVMAGVWEVELKFYRETKNIFHGSFEVKI